ncbi:DUF2142 domain-containing protein [Caballeronia sp. LP006]|uniref:DUF2142 domain-containing protein n=1 Tax=Caballeronia sp. LP006 TaxID=3038552 RepID=UPI002859C4C3|nr:DUF2142 domain-containing protein [Caballeronia sp. LP006]MDR5831968.1 DUF2142 domain-containing protein [Caballeronia sp. LP006]
MGLLYLIYALMMGAFLLYTTPPLQTPDAIAHFFRAIQVADGHVFAEKFDGTAGGKIDVAAVKLAVLYNPMAFHPAVKETATLRAQSALLRWGEPRVKTPFPNTSMYPAFSYLPQVLAIGVGRAVGASVRDTYVLTCAFGLLFSVAITALAIGLARRTSLILFAVALLPTTLMIDSSVSQEVTVLPVCILIVAIIDRFITDQRPMTGRWMALLVAMYVITASARPPYAGLILLWFHPEVVVSRDQRYGAGRRLTLAAISAMLSVISIVTFGHFGLVEFGPPHSTKGQLLHVLQHPGFLLQVAFNTLSVQGPFYVHSFIGALGWLDTYFDGAFYLAVLLMLLLAIVASCLYAYPKAQRTPAGDLVTVAAGSSSTLLIFASLYLAWSPVGGSVVEGVQGRYFLPLVGLIALIVPQFCVRTTAAASGSAERCRAVLIFLIAAFPFYTVARLVPIVVERYYLH